MNRSAFAMRAAGILAVVGVTTGVTGIGAASAGTKVYNRECVARWSDGATTRVALTFDFYKTNVGLGMARVYAVRWKPGTGTRHHVIQVRLSAMTYARGEYKSHVWRITPTIQENNPYVMPKRPEFKRTPVVRAKAELWGDGRSASCIENWD